MKILVFKIALAGLLMNGLSVGRCQPPSTPNSLTQSQLKRTKKVQVTIKDIKPTFSGSASASFTVGPKSKPTVTVYWNGYGFLCKEDSGRTFWQYSNDLAFKKHRTASFIIKKKVTITDQNGSTTVTTSDTVTVKRGVPATF